MSRQPSAEKPQPVLELNGATVYRNNRRILDGFSMQIASGEHTAIVGPNGSGKSTFIQLLTHQLHPLAGKNGIPPVRVFGKDRWDISKLRNRLGIVSADLQRHFLNSLRSGHIPGKDVVVSGFFASSQLFPHQKVTSAMRSQAAAALERMDAVHLADIMFDEMSAGEARRVLIARALVTSPSALVLDEPTTALDFVARHKCMELIRSIARQGTTVILVTHHIDEVIPEIEKVILLKEGQTAFEGPKKTVLTSDNLSKTFGHPVKLLHQNERYNVQFG